MRKDKDTSFFLFICLTALVAICFPYILAANSGNEEFIFNGFLINPLDGNSYRAKMYQGYLGGWRFQLPFTTEPGDGAYLFLFYLTLGHLGRIFKLDLIYVFHITRVLGSLVMLWSIWDFYKAVLQNQTSRRIAFAVSSLGSGMGWLVVANGIITSDLWISEAYPFLSAFTNPHFPLGIGMILRVMIIWMDGRIEFRGLILTIFLVFGLSIINPFGVVILLMVFTGRLVFEYFRKENLRLIFIGLFIVSAAGLPVLFYDLWVVNSDPVFRIWDAQNLTPSPPIWDLLLSISPSLVFGVFGAVRSLQGVFKGKGSKDIILVLWAILGIIAIYIPLDLQRRFMMGLFIPISGLAAQGLIFITRDNRRRLLVITTIFFSLAIPSNLLTLTASINGIQSQHPSIFLTKEEMSSLVWIEENTKPESVILSGPEMGLFIPAYTGRRVIYGHPFESVRAEESEKAVLDFYSGKFNEMEINKFIKDYCVDLVMIGPREKARGEVNLPGSWLKQYDEGEITILSP
jgi:hypothetical protein